LAPKSGIPQGATELGWLPDLVFTGGKFETGLAFFADAVGRITRFSREPADLALARKLPGQAALPGLVNTHSVCWQRVLRGRTDRRAKTGAGLISPWREGRDMIAARLTEQDVYEIARMAFTEMLLAGITCVGEFHELHRGAGSGATEGNAMARQILRAAHDVGIRLALMNAATVRAGYRQALGSAPAGTGFATIDAFLAATELLRTEIERDVVPDEAWLGVAASLAQTPIDAFKAVATYAHSKRMRLHGRIMEQRDDNAACAAEFGRTPVALLAEHGVIDKRFTAIHAIDLTDAEASALGGARAIVCACPTTEHNLALGLPPIEKLMAAGAGFAFGSASQEQTNLLTEARLFEYALRGACHQRPALAPDAAGALFHAATFAGARSLGSTGGALEVGRPADFFTVNIYDPSIAGADADSLLANIVYGLERRGIREVWIGARQRLVNGRHPEQGLIVGRFVELQRRLWS
jgi:formimidoylglutamate deiminase